MACVPEKGSVWDVVRMIILPSLSHKSRLLMSLDCKLWGFVDIVGDGI